MRGHDQIKKKLPKHLINQMFREFSFLRPYWYQQVFQDFRAAF